MKIKLTNLRFDALMKAVESRPDGERLRQFIDGNVREWSATIQEIDLPFVVWVDLIRTMQERSFDRSGRRRNGHSSEYKAMSDIATAINQRAMHPAYSRRFAHGASTEVLPAFERDGHWSPIPPGRFVILAPSYASLAGVGPVTKWREWVGPVDALPWSPDLEEAAHLIFGHQVQPVRGPD